MRWRFSTGKAAEEEARVAARLRAGSKFYRFLWEVREELFDDEFQDELAAVYRPRGQAPCPPALLAMVNILQRYGKLGDRAAVEEAENDQRWQLVLGTLGSDAAPFGQGTLVRFRERMMEHDLDKRLVERTIELAKRTKKFGWKNLKAMLDSSPFEGAGRVEDTWNLIGRAMSKLVNAVADALGVEPDHVIEAAGLTVLDGPSLKAALDIDWSDPDERHDALQQLVAEADALAAWVSKEVAQPPAPEVAGALKLLEQVVDQDIEPDPDGGVRIRDGVAEDRIISVGDPDMRHGRKSKSKTINGFKRHVAIANGFILGTAVEPANRREHEPTTRLLNAVRRHGDVASLDVDRGYLPSSEVAALWRAGVNVRSRPWRKENKGYFVKEDFHIDVEAGGVVCPAGGTAKIYKDGTALFSESDCGSCAMKPSCTPSRRRTLRVHREEAMLIDLRETLATREGRQAYRGRVEVEHRLARVDAIQGPKARYRGTRKNEMDLNRTATVANLQEIARLRRRKAA